MNDEKVVGAEKKKINKKQVPNKSKKASKKANKKKNGNTKKLRKQAKVLFGFIILLVAIILVLCSPLFNIKNIEVEGNSKLSNERIISVSTLQTHTNIFKFNSKLISENIKENAYVKEAKITIK